MITTGFVANVATSPRGALIRDWTGNTLTVYDASDLPPEGHLTFNGSTFAYGGLTQGDPYDTLQVTLGPPQGATEGSWVALYPPAQVTIAEVRPYEGGDSIPCVVPHALQVYLEDGVRASDDECEVVEIEQVLGVWYVKNIVGKPAIIREDVLSEPLRRNIASASGKNEIWHETFEPTSEEGIRGDSWFVHEKIGPQNQIQGPVASFWVHDGSSWIKTSLGGSTLAWVDAGSITSGVMAGIDIYSPSPLVFPHVHVGQSLIEVVRQDDDYQQFSSVQLGGQDGRDRLLFYGADGVPSAGFDESGNVLAQNANFSGGVTFQGRDLGEMIWDLPGAAMPANIFTLPSNTAKAGTSELGICDMGITAYYGRLYRIEVDSYWLIPANERAQIYLRSRTAGNGVMDVPAPTISASAVFQNAIFHAGSRGGNLRGGLVAYWKSGYRDPSGVRFLLTIKALDSNTGVGVGSSGTMTITDLGFYDGDFSDGQVNTGGGTPVSGSQTNPVKSKVTYTTTWNADWVKSWQGSTVRDDYLHQGYISESPGQRYSHIGFTGLSVSGETGKTLAQALSGATVTKAELWAENVHTYASTGANLRVGHSTLTGPPGSPQTSGGEAVAYGWARGAKKWVRLPAEWNSGWVGTYRSLSIGEGAGTSSANYGKWNRNLSALKLRLTYTK